MKNAYKIIANFFFYIAPFYLKFRILKKKEHPERYKEKLSIINKDRGDGFLVWFHAASVGEVLSIIPLVKKLSEIQKIKKILITTITTTSYDVLNKKLNEHQKITHQFLPLDIPKLTKIFINHWSPDLAIFVESEIWPNLIFDIKEKKIPLLLLNARITKKTFEK